MFLENFAINIFGIVIFAPVILLLLNWTIEQMEEVSRMTVEDWLIMLGFFGVVAIITLINL
jgi:hypothetical protein